MNFNFSPIGVIPVSISEKTDIIFVSDMFKEDYSGGAELTSEALIESSPLEVQKIHSKDVSMSLLEQGVNKFWIFGNFAQIDINLLPSVVANLSYSILEYDYKFCVYRSPEKHLAAAGELCNCHNETHGKIMSAFFYGARSLWWMSEKQQELYFKMFPFLRERSNVVLSSVFSERFFAQIKLLRNKYKDSDRDKWVSLGSESWIKGSGSATDWCEQNNKEYEVISGLTHDQTLEKLAQAKGFVYLPLGNDTCPRMVIEAKLLGCELHLNENVQHKDELWFTSDDEFDTEAYLYAARERFWNGIKYDMSWSPSVSGYTTVNNCISQNYPFCESINSLLGFCDEVVVVDGGSDDGTWELLQETYGQNENIILHQQKRDWSNSRFAVFDGAQKALARSICSSAFCWQQDSDEIVHENDYEKIKTLVKNFPKNTDLIALPVIEYWGGPAKVRADINPWKWRLSRNNPDITHGIPAELRKFDFEGNLYAMPGTDGCDYVKSSDYTRIPFASFYTQEVNNVKNAAMTNPEALESYQNWFNQIIEAFPSVHHYSWFNINRKIKTYKNYWSKHWQSLYDISQEDTPENNMFFDKSWGDVTEEEISDISKKLADEMGGWIFHTKVDFNTPTPHIEIQLPHPSEMTVWMNK
jgi:glycosyltransferase involved in cell wall biosynthesis